jgi:YNFM family putative membrane transporter
MSDSPVISTHIKYGTRPFFAILLSLFLAGFSSFSSLYCVQPMMPIFAQFFAVSPTHSSFPLSASTIALAVGLLFSGLISDRFGRKVIMVWALVLTALLLILSSLFPIWEIFIGTRVLIGFAVSGVAAVAMTYIGEEIAQQDIGLAMGLYISGTAIGGMGGRLIAGVLIDFMAWQKVILLIGILNFISAVIFYLILPQSKHFKAYPIAFSRFKKSFIKNFSDSKLRLLFAQGFILMGCFVTIFNYMSYHLLEKPFQLSQIWIGLISVAYLAGIYSSPRAAKWGEKFGRHRVLPVMLICMLIGLWLMRTTSIGLVLLGLGIFTFAFFAAHSTCSSWVAVQALQYRAVGSSLYLFSYYMGSSFLGSSSGLVWEYFGWNGLTAFISVILFLGLFFAVNLSRQAMISIDKN